MAKKKFKVFYFILFHFFLPVSFVRTPFTKKKATVVAVMPGYSRTYTGTSLRMYVLNQIYSIWRWLHVTGENTCVLMILSLRRNQIFSCDIYVGKIRHKLDGDVVGQMALKRPVSSLRVTTTHPRTCPRTPWTLCGSLFRLRVCSRLSHLLWPPGGRAFRVRSQPAPDNYFWGGPETAFLARNTFFTLH